MVDMKSPSLIHKATADSRIGFVKPAAVAGQYAHPLWLFLDDAWRW